MARMAVRVPNWLLAVLAAYAGCVSLVGASVTGDCMTSGSAAEAWSPLNVSVQANSHVAPDGTMTADALVPRVFGANESRYVYRGANCRYSTGTYTVYVKPNGCTSFQITYNASGPDWKARSFTLTGSGLMGELQNGGGTVTSNHGGGIEPVGNGWYRVWVTFSNASSSNPFFYHALTFGGASTGNESVYVWGATYTTGTTPPAPWWGTIEEPPTIYQNLDLRLMDVPIGAGVPKVRMFNNGAWVAASSYQKVSSTATEIRYSFPVQTVWSTSVKFDVTGWGEYTHSSFNNTIEATSYAPGKAAIEARLSTGGVVQLGTGGTTSSAVPNPSAFSCDPSDADYSPCECVDLSATGSGGCCDPTSVHYSPGFCDSDSDGIPNLCDGDSPQYDPSKCDCDGDGTCDGADCSSLGFISSTAPCGSPLWRAQPDGSTGTMPIRPGGTYSPKVVNPSGNQYTGTPPTCASQDCPGTGGGGTGGGGTGGGGTGGGGTGGGGTGDGGGTGGGGTGGGGTGGGGTGGTGTGYGGSDPGFDNTFTTPPGEPNGGGGTGSDPVNPAAPPANTPWVNPSDDLPEAECCELILHGLEQIHQSLSALRNAVNWAEDAVRDQTSLLYAGFFQVNQGLGAANVTLDEIATRMAAANVLLTSVDGRLVTANTTLDSIDDSLVAVRGDTGAIRTDVGLLKVSASNIDADTTTIIQRLDSILLELGDDDEPGGGFSSDQPEVGAPAPAGQSVQLSQQGMRNALLAETSDVQLAPGVYSAFSSNVASAPVWSFTVGGVSAGPLSIPSYDLVVDWDFYEPFRLWVHGLILVGVMMWAAMLVWAEWRRQ